MSIKVQKRNGTLEDFDLSKIEKMVRYACQEFPTTNPDKLLANIEQQIFDGIDTHTIQKILVQTALEKIITRKSALNGKEPDEIKPEYSFVASKLFLADLYKMAARTRNYNTFGYGDFYKLVELGTDSDIYNTSLLDSYTKSEIEELGGYIDEERDYLLSYYGAHLLATRYLTTLTQDNKQLPFELPQERFMIVAMAIASAEAKEQRVEYAKKFYDLISQLKMTVATPTLANAGTKLNQLSSCFVSVIPDDLNGIYNSNNDFANISKYGGAAGFHMGSIRCLGSSIRNHPNASGGIVPWAKLLSTTAVSVDQLGRRKGSVSLTLDVWHKDIYEFLELKRNNGDDRRKAHDVFPSVSIPDIFMKRLESRSEWSLFDPHEVHLKTGKRLEDYYDDSYNNSYKFSEFYEYCESRLDISRTTVPALEIMKRLLRSAVETGTPFVFFRDTANSLNPNNHKGMVYSSNLCHEIIQNASSSKYLGERYNPETNTLITEYEPGEMVTCNLSSINLGRIKSLDELKEIIPLQVRMLDNVITINNLPLAIATETNAKYRSIGLGTSGYHQYLANRKIKWESQEHYDEAQKLFEEISYQTIKASMELSKEKGNYPYFKGSQWDTGEWFKRRDLTTDRWVELQENIKKHGLRNGYLIAIAPTGSTSHISDSTAGIDPVFKKYWIEEKANAVLPKTAPDLSDENFWYYKEAHTIDQDYLIKAGAVRQKFIDQSQSLNLYINTETTSKQILDMYIKCWKEGLKTIYYLRSQSEEVDECTSCSS